MYILYSIYPQICNFSLIACYSLEFTLCLLLVGGHSLLVTLWRSLLAWYSLEFTPCLLLVGVHSLLVMRCKICCSLQNSLSTPTEELCMLQKITHYSSPDLLNVKCKASLIFKGALTGLRQIFGNWKPFEMIENAFYFTSKAFFVLKIFKFLSWLFGHVSKRLD